jgi:GntR family transcriptional repressor for pyruvate dehydrogenase complex
MPDMPTTFPAARLADAVASTLEKRILEGSLRPGDRLPAERELAVELGVSRPSLREAIQRLAAKGLLTTRHGGGTVVTDRLEAHFAEPWQQMLEGHPLLQRDLLEFRQMLESQAAALAAERATDVDIACLDAAYATLEAQYESDQLDACIDADVAFHQAVAAASHNVMIGQLTASLMRVIHGHIARNLEHLHASPARWAELRGQHRAIWMAIRERRADAAAAAARGHIEFVRRSIDDNALLEARRSVALRRLGEAVG